MVSNLLLFSCTSLYTPLALALAAQVSVLAKSSLCMPYNMLHPLAVASTNSHISPLAVVALALVAAHMFWEASCP
jgi:hypothetical protein